MLSTSYDRTSEMFVLRCSSGDSCGRSSSSPSSAPDDNHNIQFLMQIVGMKAARLAKWTTKIDIATKSGGFASHHHNVMQNLEKWQLEKDYSEDSL